jgi:hypothetical protein
MARIWFTSKADGEYWVNRSDAFIVEWFTEKAGLELRQVGALLRDFRASRERHRES